jgi:hypothetical protein
MGYSNDLSALNINFLIDIENHRDAKKIEVWTVIEKIEEISEDKDDNPDNKGNFITNYKLDFYFK